MLVRTNTITHVRFRAKIGGMTGGVVVVGAGLAGVHTVKALRDRGFAGPITVLGEEPHAPYDRPPLTKQFLAGEVDDTTLPELDARLCTGRAATGLGDGEVRTTDGALAYDHLVIATGAKPRTLPAEDGAAVFTIRTVDDARALRSRLTEGHRLVVVGAGWIGAEVAGTAAALGCRVEVLEAASTVLPSCGFGELATAFEPWYAEAGVRLRLDTKVRGIAADAVELEDGTRIPADTVVVGIGVVPNTGWLEQSPIDRDARGAIEVDARLRTSLPQVYATGDCAAYTSRRYGGPLLLEHWTHAQASPRTIAENILGGEAEYDDVPYFWSRQFGRMVQYLGRHSDDDTLVLRGDPAGEKWSACWLRDGALTAVLAAKLPKEIVQARMLFAKEHTMDADLLADPERKLSECVRA